MRYEPICRAIVVVLVSLSVAPGVVMAQESEAARGLTRLPITDAEGNRVGLYTGSFALVVGVSNYTHWPDLPGVARDVEQVREALEAQGFGVTVVRDPTREELNLAFDNFIHTHGLQPEHRVLIYFAGHGHTLPLPYGDLNMGYIVPSDAPRPPPDPEDYAGDFIASAMDMEQIRVYARRIHAKHALFLFDSCFSGSIFALTRAIPANISAKTAQPVRQFITAGAEDEEVPDESVFRQQFVLALQGEADADRDGYVTGTELGDFLQSQVEHYGGGTQHPQYGKLRDQYLNKGDFVFPLPRDPEQERWDEVKDSTRPADVRAFLEDFPTGRYAGDAEQKLIQMEQTRWDAIADSTRPTDFRAFLADFPTGRFANNANEILAQLEQTRWDAIADSTRPADFRAFLEDFPTGRYANRAEEIWAQLREVQTCKTRWQANQPVSAADCFQAVLRRDPDNAPAIEGLNTIAEHYHERARDALQQAQRDEQTYRDTLQQVQDDMQRLRQINPEYPALVDLQRRVSRLRRSDTQQLESLRAEVSRLEREVRQKNQALQRAQEQLRQSQAQVSDLQQEVRQQSQTLGQAQEQVTRLQREAQQKDQALQQAQAQVARLEQGARSWDEARRWEEVKESRCAADFQAFRAEYPSGRFANAALQKWREFEPEARSWNRVKASTQASDFVDFLAAWQDGCFAEEARGEIRRLRQLRTWNEPATGMVFVHVPAGCFQMGSPATEAGRYADEGPRHEVCVDDFWLAEMEVTNAQYRRFRPGHDSGSAKGGTLNGDTQPVVQVSWEQAQAYADWLSQRSAYTFALPTEAEWEYACRAGTQTARPWGQATACRHANVNDQTADGFFNCEDGRPATAPVGHYASNAFGLYDMLGNVSEWVQDTYARNVYPSGRRGVRNPIRESPRVDAHRVIRGGNAWSTPRHVRCAMRNHDTPDDTLDGAGFRLRMTQKAQPPRREQRQAGNQAQGRQAEAQTERRAQALEPGQRFRDCDACPEMVVVPAGSYMMGSPSDEAERYDDEGPRHRVRIAEPFAVGVHEVTRGEFAQYVRETNRSMGDTCRVLDDEDEWVDGQNRHWRNPGFEQTDRHPVVCVSWDDARAYTRWLSVKTGERYRLLSESEWEYVARAGTTGPFHTGATIAPNQANYDGNYRYGSGPTGAYRERTAPVGSYAANAFGLRDVHGNVLEWTQDCWNDSYRDGPNDGLARERGDCAHRVFRGGSWFNTPNVLRAAYRDSGAVGHRGSDFGFRVRRALAP